MHTFTTNRSFNESIYIEYDYLLNIRLIIFYFSENRFIAEQTIDYADRRTTLRFANDTIDEPVDIHESTFFIIHLSDFSARTCS